ncbi:MAG: SDR family oxidoreductase [Candidatus Doudnabacteria bacterium]
MQIKDKVIIITGASQGIGLATAKILSQAGAKVVLAARSADKLQKLQAELSGSLAVPSDLRKLKDIKNLAAKTIEKFGRVDILINNAGQGIYGNLENINVDDFRQVMELNIFAVVEMMQAVIPLMRKQGGGMIVNVSSGLSRMFIPGLSAYASTKHALNALTFTARAELAEDKIIVSAILPKMTATDFGANSVGQRPDFTKRPGGMPSVDQPEDVAAKIVELINSEAQEIVL